MLIGGGAGRDGGSSSDSDGVSGLLDGDGVQCIRPQPAPWRQRWQQGPRRHSGAPEVRDLSLGGSGGVGAAAGGKDGSVTHTRDWQEEYGHKDRSSGLAYMYGGTNVGKMAGEVPGRVEVEGDNVRPLSGDTAHRSMSTFNHITR